MMKLLLNLIVIGILNFSSVVYGEKITITKLDKIVNDKLITSAGVFNLNKLKQKNYDIKKILLSGCEKKIFLTVHYDENNEITNIGLPNKYIVIDLFEDKKNPEFISVQLAIRPSIAYLKKNHPDFNQVKKLLEDSKTNQKVLWIAINPFTSIIDAAIEEVSEAKPAAKSELDFLRPMKGKYIFETDLLSNSKTKDRLKKLTGADYNAIAQWDVASPIEVKNDMFVASACMPHNCDVSNYIIVADISNNLFFVGVRKDGKIKTYSEDKSREPDELKKWYANK